MSHLSLNALDVGSEDPVFLDLVEGLIARVQQGETIDISSWLRQHPDEADRIRELWPAIQLMADLSQPSSKELPKVTVQKGDGMELRVLGDYRLIRELGRGGMGVVYEAEQLSLARSVALKILPFAATLDSRHLQRFQNEARAAASLNHPHIVPVYGVGCERGVHYYAMRLIEGQTVSDLIVQMRQNVDRGTIPALSLGSLQPSPTVEYTPSRAESSTKKETIEARKTISGTTSNRGKGEFAEIANFGLQLAEALHHAHEMGIVHRDIKPSNLLVDSEGLAWVTDFGLAHLETGVHITRTGDLVGTLRYMSPEQASGEQALVDRRTDIYGLGTTLYELLTLCPAFTARGRARLLDEVIASEPVTPRQIDSVIPRDLETIVLKAMAKDPGDRYSTAQKMAEDLRHFIEGEPIEARPVGTVERIGRWCRRNPSVTALVTVIVLAVLTIVPGTLWLMTTLQLAASERRTREELEKAEKLARYYSLIDRTRRRSSDRRLGWPSKGLEDLKEAASLATEARNPVELRSEICSCLAGVDLREREVLLEDFNPGAIAYSPDGKTLAVAEHKSLLRKAGVVLLVDVTTRKIRQRLLFPLTRDLLGDKGLDGAKSLAFDPSGNRLALGTRYGWISIWDLKTNSLESRWQAGKSRIDWLRFSPDGRSIYSCAHEESLVRWDATDRGKHLASFAPPHWSTIPDLSEDGQLLAVGSKRQLYLLDAETLHAFRKPLDYFGGCVRFSPDRRFLAIESWKAIELVDAKTGTVIRTLKDPAINVAHQYVIEHLEFSADGSLLVSSCGYSRDRKVKLWEVASGRLLVTLSAESVGPLEVAFSPEGSHLVVSHAQRVLLYEIAGLDILTRIAHHMRPLRAVRFSPDGRLLACLSRASKNGGGYSNGCVTLWNVANGEQMGQRELSYHSWPENLAPLAFSPRGNTLLSCGWTKGIHEWNLDGKKPKNNLSGVKPIALSFSADGSRVWGVLENDSVGSWEWPSGRSVSQWKNLLADPSTLLCVSAGRRKVLVGGKNGKAYLFGADDGHLEQAWPSMNSPIWCVALNPSETRAAWGTHEGRVRVVDLPSGRVLADLKDHHDEVAAIAFDSSGTLLATGSRDRTIRLYVCTKEKVRPLMTSRPGAVVDLDFRPDGRKLACVIDQERAVRIWHLDRLRERLSEMNLDEPAWASFPNRQSLNSTDEAESIKFGFDWHGEIAWQRQLESEGVHRTVVLSGSKQQLIVGGSTRGLAIGQNGDCKAEAMVQAIDLDGKELWSRQFGTPEEDRVFGLAVASSGFYVSGWTRGEFSGQQHSGKEDIFLRKCDSEGNLLWVQQLGTAESEVGCPIAADSTGVYLATQWHDVEKKPKKPNFLVRKYSSDGKAMWNHTMDSSVEDVQGLALNSSGVYVVGSTRKETPKQNAVDARDAFVCKYSQSGSLLWKHSFGSSARDWVRGVATDETGVYIVGVTWGQLGIAHIGGEDVFIRKYDNEGNCAWTCQYGSGGNEVGLAVTTNDSGVYVVGHTSGLLLRNNRIGKWDAFVSKLSLDGELLGMRQFGTTEDDQATGVKAVASGVYVTGWTTGSLTEEEKKDRTSAFLLEVAP